MITKCSLFPIPGLQHKHYSYARNEIRSTRFSEFCFTEVLLKKILYQIKVDWWCDDITIFGGILVRYTAASGKTALLEQFIYGNHIISTPMFSTIEDTYVAYVDTERGREKVRFYDTAGCDPQKPDLPRHYFSCIDGVILLYDVTNWDSFAAIDKLKKDIDKNKEKRDLVIIALGNKCDLKESRQVDFATAQTWAQKEKVKLWEISCAKRQSMMDAFVWLTTKMNQPPAKSTMSFNPLSRKQKSAPPTQPD
ncbi:unnamed protein product [Owenia fusiformis]|uniref:Uncharacterized protein n=1 Tax=Owenia fusiformis TaxID=6347 RepID=A0A8S4P8T1_OWEFU|nr:unnamed protein product [Owenia fusiformis]